MNYIILVILIIILFILIILYKGIKLKINYKINNTKLKINLKVQIFTVKIFQTTIPKDKKETKEEKDEDENNNLKNIIPLIKESKNEIITILKIFKNSTKIIKFKNHIKIGLEDYVKTVEIIGYIWTINTILNISDKNTLTAETDFNNETIQITGKLEFQINLLKFLIKIITKKELLIFIKKIIGELKK